MEMTLLYAGKYPEHRELALRLKAGGRSAAREAASLLLPLLPDGPVILVPVPSHSGRPAGTLRLARSLQALRRDQPTHVLPFLRCRPHESAHVLKHGGTPAADIPAPVMRMSSHRTKAFLEEKGRNATVILVDDVADTGATLLAAARATGATHAAVLDITENTPYK